MRQFSHVIGTYGLGGPPSLIVALGVQVPNNHILTQNLYYNYYYPKPRFLLIGYLDPLGGIQGIYKDLSISTITSCGHY